MNLKYKEKVKINYQNTLLSAIKPQTTLSLKQINKPLNLKLDSKAILKVYIDEETNKKYVEVAAAYALGLTKVRAIMTGNDRYKEVTDDKINEVRKRNYDVEYVKLPKKEKQKIQVFYEDNRYYISSGAAYALGYIDVTKFNLDDNKYGPLTDEELKNIKNNFEVEFQNIKTKNEDSKVL